MSLQSRIIHQRAQHRIAEHFIAMFYFPKDPDHVRGGIGVVKMFVKWDKQSIILYSLLSPATLTIQNI